MSGELQRANRAQPGAEAVHVVHKIEGVDDGEQPEDRDGVAERDAGHEERDALANGGDGHGDEQLADEFRQRLQLVPVIEPAEKGNGDRAERKNGEFHRALVNAVNDQTGGGNFDRCRA